MLLAAACALVLAAIVPWGDMQDHSHWGRVVWVPFGSRRLRPRDIVQNVLLFVPVGVGAALVFRRAIGAAAVVALSLSLTGELLQVYSHERFPSATDVVCNIVGAVGAAGVAGWWRRRHHRRVD